MNLIRQSAWMVVILGASIGCTGEEPAAPSNPAPSNPAPAPSKPALSAPAKTDGAGEGAPKDMEPAPAKPAEGHAADGKKADEPPKIEGPKADATSKGGTAAVKLTADEIAAIKELPAADQEPALKQAVCPVSTEHLGEMGKPIKVSVEGRTVYLCCDSCEEKIKADPKKYLATLDAKAEKK